MRTLTAICATLLALAPVEALAALTRLVAKPARAALVTCKAAVGLAAGRIGAGAMAAGIAIAWGETACITASWAVTACIAIALAETARVAGTVATRITTARAVA